MENIENTTENIVPKKRGRPKKVADAIVPDNQTVISEQPEVAEEIKVMEAKTEELKKEAQDLSKIKAKTVEYLTTWENQKNLVVPKAAYDKYPDMHFCWVLNSDKRILQKEGIGYEFVRLPNTKNKSKDGTVIGIDDLVRNGDLVLMGIPKEMYTAREMYIEKEIKARAGSLSKESKLHTEGQSISNQIGKDVPVFATYKRQ